MFGTGTVTIIYKSGAKVHFKCKNFTCRKQGSTLLEANWDGIRKNDPRPLLFGVEEVAAVWDGKV